MNRSFNPQQQYSGLIGAAVGAAPDRPLRELNAKLNANHKELMEGLQQEAMQTQGAAKPAPPLFRALSDLEHHIDEIEVAIRGLHARLGPIMEPMEAAIPPPPAAACAAGIMLEIERASYRLAALEGFVSEIQSRLHI